MQCGTLNLFNVENCNPNVCVLYSEGNINIRSAYNDHLELKTV